MKPATAVLSVMLLLALAGCNRSPSANADSGGGHYSGVGIYEADGLWRHVQGAPATKDEQAKLKDDSRIIVVVDRDTGEIRQCGNHSGFCMAMNPWKGAAPALPTKLDAHADELGELTKNAVNAVEVEPTEVKDKGRK